MTYDIQKEKREAIDAGRKAISSLETARDNLNSAKNWGLVDMFGGGFFTTMIKHSKIDQAKRKYGAGQIRSAEFQQRTAGCEYGLRLKF